MKTLEELLLEDFVLCFFGKWIDSPFRDYLINTHMDCFPKGETCIGIFNFTTAYEEITANIIDANYIKD